MSIPQLDLLRLLIAQRMQMPAPVPTEPVKPDVNSLKDIAKKFSYVPLTADAISILIEGNFPKKVGYHLVSAIKSLICNLILPSGRVLTLGANAPSAQILAEQERIFGSTTSLQPDTGKKFGSLPIVNRRQYAQTLALALLKSGIKPDEGCARTVRRVFTRMVSFFPGIPKKFVVHPSLVMRYESEKALLDADWGVCRAFLATLLIESARSNFVKIDLNYLRKSLLFACEYSGCQIINSFNTLARQIGCSSEDLIRIVRNDSSFSGAFNNIDRVNKEIAESTIQKPMIWCIRYVRKDAISYINDKQTLCLDYFLMATYFMLRYDTHGLERMHSNRYEDFPARSERARYVRAAQLFSKMIQTLKSGGKLKPEDLSLQKLTK